MSRRDKPNKGKPKDDLKVIGWVEVIVRDKHGRIKHRIGTSPEEIALLRRKKHNSHSAYGLASSFPAKQIDDLYWRKNIITDDGLAAIIRLVFEGLTETKFGYLAIGVGTTTETASDTALETEIARKSANVTQTTTDVTDDTALLEATFSSDDGLSGTDDVSETGIFNDATAGIMLARKTFSPVTVNWDAGDTLTIKYYVQMSR